MSSFVFAGAFCVSLIGAVVQSVCGFGYGPLNMSLLPYLMPYPQAVALAGLCGTTTAVMVAVSGWRHANWRKVWPCTVTSVILSGLFVWLSTRAADTLMLHLLGCVLIALGLYSLFFNGKIRIRPTVRNGIIAGAISGVTSGLFAVGGPPMAIYLIGAADNNDEYRSTLNAHFCVNSIMTTFMRWRSGVFTAPVMHLYVLLLAALLIGAWIGTKIFHRLDQNKLRKVVYGYLVVSGLLLFLK